MPNKLNMPLPTIIKSNLYLLILAAWFITFSFIVDNYWSANSGTRAVVKRLNEYVQQNESDFYRTVKDSRTFPAIQNDSIHASDLEALMQKDFYLYVYKLGEGNPRLQFWASQHVLPGNGILLSGSQSGFAQLVNGFYVWHKYDTADKIFVSLLPIKWNYVVTNDYLRNEFTHHISVNHQYDIFPGASGNHTIKTLESVPLFYIRQLPGTVQGDSIVSILLKLFASFFVLLFIHFCARFIAQQMSVWKAIGFLVLSLMLLRLPGYLWGFPFNAAQMELFNTTLYQSRPGGWSLGDLLINVGLFAWVMVFAHLQLNAQGTRLKLKHPFYKWPLLVIGCFVIVSANFVAGKLIRSLISDSQISFDVINFFSLNFYTIIGFLILCSLCIAYYFLCKTILMLLRPFYHGFFVELYITVCVAGLMLLSFGLGSLAGGFAFYALLWLLLFLLLIEAKQLHLIANRVVSSKLVFWIFFFSLSITVVIIFENNRKELKNRYHYAETLAAKTNPANESLVNSMIADFRVGFLSANFFRLQDSVSNKFLKDSIVENNFSGYRNRFDTRVYSFDRNNKPLYNDGAYNFDQLSTILNSQAKPTAIKGLYYYDESFDSFNYISKKAINDTSGHFLGTIFFVVTPKKIKNEMIYPELFSKGKDNAIENSSLYSFAIYNEGKLIRSHNDFPFPTSMPPIVFKDKRWLGAKTYQYDQLWYNAGGGKYILIVKENRLFIAFITLFSYLFCAFLIMAACVWILSVFVQSGFKFSSLRRHWQLSIRNQIHAVIIFISVLSFLVIGTATILFFINRYQSNNREKLSRVIQIMKGQVSSAVQQGWAIADSLGTLDNLHRTAVEKSFLNIADVHGVDVNIYDLSGALKLSSLPTPYLNGILSTRMEPMAYQHLARQKEVQYFQKEHIGRFEYLSCYVPVSDDKGNVFAYLNIPYFTSQSNLQQEIANFLVTIINLNAFIFLIAGIVALFIASRITHSFSVIADKMKKVNLGTYNEEIVWNRNDEIGSLVNEYNTMVGKLDASAAALAKSEREEAWREMAKQVAHEIKNPLTPMKLSLQFLQRAIQNNADDVNELTAKVSQTLVEQIDYLNKIASDFSQFANIEKAERSTFDAIELLKSMQRLYDADTTIAIQWRLGSEPLWIYADKAHINRLFTNLILNAMQSVPAERHVQVEIEALHRGEQVLIKLSDNGDGIPEEAQSKIFMPNFTTKSSGTGLGLAMSKRIVEQAGGSIWFETMDGAGTTFFVALPLVTHP